MRKLKFSALLLLRYAKLTVAVFYSLRVLKPAAVLFLLLTTIANLLQAQQTINVNSDMVFCLTAVKGTQPWTGPNEKASDLFDGNYTSAYQSIITSSNGTSPILPMVIIVELKQTCAISQIKFGYVGEGQTPLNVKVEFGKPGAWVVPGAWNGIISAPMNNDGEQSFNTNLNLTSTNRFLKFTFQQVFRGGIKFIGAGDCAWSLPSYNPALMPKTPMDRFMGTNSNIGQNNQRTAFMVAPFGALREYVNWAWSESGPDVTALGSFPNENRYHFGPTLPEGSDNSYDSYFRQMKEMGVDVLADMMSTAPGMITVSKTGNTETNLNQTNACNKMQFWERKPVNLPFGQTSSLGNEFWVQDPNSPIYSNPTAYVRQADRLFQFTARYGKGNVAASDMKMAPSNGTHRNLGLVDHIENWNEGDKWWFAPNVNQCGVPDEAERRRQYFTPLEYAAMTMADHNDQDLYSLPVPGSSKLGLRRADPNMPSVMSGISEFDTEYLKGLYMAFYEMTGNANAWPFKAVGLHHYAFEDNHGMHPEQDFANEYESANGHLKKIMQFVQHRLPAQTEVWVTEFGWSSYANDGSSAKPAYGGADLYKVQAQWILRQMLLYQGAGISRAYQFSLLNTLAGGGGLFAFCGTAGMDFTSNGATIQFKPSWYAVYTMKNALKGLTFQQESVLNTSGQSLRMQRYGNIAANQTAFVLWSPTENNISVSNATFNTGIPNAEVTVVQIADGKIDGSRHTLTANAAGVVTINVPVTEMPLIALVNAPFMPACDCHVPVSIISDQSAAQNLVNEQAKLNGSALLCGFGPSMSQPWNATTGTANVRMKTAEGQNTTYDLHGVYLNYMPGSNADINIKFYTSDDQLIAYRGNTAGYTFHTDDFSAGYWGAGFTWRRLEDLQMPNVARVAVTIVSGTATLGEIAICGKTPLLDGPGGGGPTDTITIVDPNGPQCPVPSGVTSLSAVQLNTTNNTVRLTWGLPQGAPTNTSAYKLEFASSNGLFVPFTGAMTKISNNKIMALVPELNLCTNYRFRVRYIDTCGQISEWRIRQRYLNGGCTIGQPSETTQAAGDCEKGLLKWKYGVQKPGVTFVYEAFVTNNANLVNPNANNATKVENLPAVAAIAGTQVSFWAKNLQPGKNYRFFLRVKGSDASTTPWVIQNVTTKAVALCSTCACNWVPLDETSIFTDGSSVANTGIDATKMVDEQDFIIDINNPCELLPASPSNGPSTEMGENWGVGNNIIAKFNIVLPQSGQVKHIRLFDGDGCIAGLPDADNDGCKDDANGFALEFRRPGETTWQPLNNINTSKWREWREFAVNDNVAAFRLTKLHNHARINEIAVCMVAGTTQNLVQANPDPATTPVLPAILTLGPTDINQLKVYPNPTTEKLNLSLTQAVPYTYQLISTNGSVLKQGSGNGQTQLPIQDLPQGVYVLQVQTGSKVFTERIVKQ